MADGKRRLPLYNEGRLSQFDDTEVLKLQDDSFVSSNCFFFYSFDNGLQDGKIVERDNPSAALNYMNGLASLHEGHWFPDGSDKQRNKYERAFASFQQALAAKPNYFCARVGLKEAAEKLGLEDIAENEEYAIQHSDNPHPEMPCHLTHVGFLNADGLKKTRADLKILLE
jgi:hypothetical protein